MNLYIKQRINICYVILLFITQASVLSCYEIYDDSARGLRVASNNQVTVYARNVETTILVYFDFNGYPINCVDYPDNFFVYSLDVIKNQVETEPPDNFTFVCVWGMSNNATIVLSVVKVNVDSNGCTSDGVDTSIWNGTEQAYINVKVDPRGQYAYVFADSFSLSFDILQNKIVECVPTDSLFQVWPYLPRAFDLTDKWAVVAGLVQTQTTLIPTIYLMQLQPLSFLNDIWYPDWIDILYDGLYTNTYARANDMTVSLSPTKDRALIGIPMYNSVFIATINYNSSYPNNSNINIINEAILPISDIGFGRSVAWIDNKTIIVTVLTLLDRFWSQSELWIFNIDETSGKPLFVFPNNQQTLKLKRRPLFLQIVSTPKALYIVTDQTKLIVYPVSPAGFVTDWSDDYSLNAISIMKPKICIAGTYKNTSGFGPCTICPPQTMNPSDDTSKSYNQCRPCTPTSFCPLGSTDDISLDGLSSYTQSFSYPDTPNINNYDDLLFQNMFVISATTHCIPYSPMFWGVLIIALCFLIWFIMKILKLYKFRSTHRYRNKAKRVLKQFDIISEGERWIGGLFSIAAIVLISFSFWFASQYRTTYPIRISNSIFISCQTDMHNTLYSSALQLPLPSVDGKHLPILDMFNNQPLTMTIDLVNTRAVCSSITVQQNRPSVKYLPIQQNCTTDSVNNATLSATFSVPPHPTTIQMNITGAYFIGGIRLCLRGPQLVQEVNTLHQLDACQFYFTENQTIGHDVTIPIILIKMINETKQLQVDGDTFYDGRWIPTWNTASGLCDQLIYEQDGEYLRYASYQSFLTIILTEQPFFLQNTQQPIIRTAELIFHTLLFTSLVIELFGFAFLIIKIFILPFLIPILRYFRKRTSASSNEVIISRIDELKPQSKSKVSYIDKCRKQNHLFNDQRQESDDNTYF